MLAVTAYPQAYIDACRAAVTAQVSAYEALTALAHAGDARLRSAIATFEPLFLHHMLLALDAYFCHRQRSLEGKDGNPLNEVRVLCTSITSNGSVLAADKAVKLKPATSVLGYAVGDEISLDGRDFARLAEAFFAELERRYAAPATVDS